MVTKYYIDKQEFHNEICKFNETKKVSDNLGDMIFKLAEKNTHSKFFNNYSLADKEDMRTDAVIACLKSLHKFDTNRANAFAYFTSIVINAFRYYLKKKYSYSNFKLDMVEDAYHKANKPFNNQIKKDIEENRREKSRKKNGGYINIGDV